MKVYTRTGDDGETALFGGQRVAKDHPRVRAYGAVDSANASLGLAAAASLPDPLPERLLHLMSGLFDAGAELATPPEDDDKLIARLQTAVDDEAVRRMEAWIDEAEAELPPLKTFVLPTGTDGAARLHVARTEVRRAEREVVGLSTMQRVRPEVVRYLNRLSDLLFVWARLANHRAGVGDVPWQPRKGSTTEET